MDHANPQEWFIIHIVAIESKLPMSQNITFVDIKDIL